VSEPLRAPFPAFGGKRAIASLVWERFGVVDNYVEPFVNSATVGLAAPFVPAMETWNDRNGFIANFWRAVQTDPEAVARWADWPVNEADLHARHAWLVRQEDDITARLMGDPEWHDARVAGWWLWGICQWIGSGWCSGEGPWTVNADGLLVNSDAGRGVTCVFYLVSCGHGKDRGERCCGRRFVGRAL
jgi:DNA adenine methylase